MNISSLIENLIEEYNSGLYEKIYDSFSVATKDALPLGTIKSFFANMYKNYGLIREITPFVNNGLEHHFKVLYDNGAAKLTLLLTSDFNIDKISFSKLDDTVVTTKTTSDTQFALPFSGKWKVVWGGDTEELNYHHPVKSQKFAFDFFITNETGLTCENGGVFNENYFAFGQQVFSPYSGIVEFVVDGIPDNMPGDINNYYVPGNSVLIKLSEKEYLFLAHFKQSSLLIKPGEQISKGQLLGLCGNSGRSSQPHIHLHLQSSNNFSSADGIKMEFSQVSVNSVYRKKHFPIKGEIVENA